ncbi:MAG TPA: hypothetical protein VFI59_02290 [Actinomycetota bacterium]|nr:hypothetical protein [Actinomycetota bacterium]
MTTAAALTQSRKVRGAGLRTRYAQANDSPIPAAMNSTVARSVSSLSILG